ncbi:MAG: hypothetical protein WCP03_02755 [Candidatus Saccharibacteria bacterium]
MSPRDFNGKPVRSLKVIKSKNAKIVCLFFAVVLLILSGIFVYKYYRSSTNIKFAESQIINESKYCARVRQIEKLESGFVCYESNKLHKLKNGNISVEIGFKKPNPNIEHGDILIYTYDIEADTIESKAMSN